MTGSAKRAAGIYTDCVFLLIVEQPTGRIFHPRVLPRCFVELWHCMCAGFVSQIIPC